jgi:hypothetical protein
MSPRWGAVAAVSIAAFGLARPARAQHVEYRASLTFTGSYTQSISDAPASSAAASANYAGPSFMLSPSIVALIDTPRTENTLGYAFTLSVPFLQQGGVTTPSVTYSNRVSYAGHYALSEITSMTLGASLTESPLNSLVPSQDPTSTPVQAAPNGLAYVLTTTLTEGVSRLLSERNSFSQAASFLYGDPIEPGMRPAQTFSATNSFSFSRAFSRDLLGVTLTNQLNYITEDATMTPVVSAYSVWVNSLTANWQHAFTEAFAMNLVAGALQTLSPEATPVMQFQPTGSAVFSYNFLLASAALAYSHGVQPNVMTGTVNLADILSLRFAAPIGLTGLTTTGTVGYTHAIPLGMPASACTGDAATCRPSDVYGADLGLDYHTERLSTLTVGVRGQAARQVMSGDPTNSFVRYTAALNLTYSYPNARAATTRPQLSPLLSAQPPAASDVISTERYFSSPVAGPDPEEPPPKPKGP